MSKNSIPGKKMSEESKEIYSLIIPMRGTTILIPSKALAEIVPFIDSEPAPKDSPQWFLGSLHWRGLKIPVISYEQMVDENFPPLDRRLKMVAIINTQIGNKDMPYLGIGVEGIPRLGLVNEESIEHSDPKSAEKLHPTIAADVIFNSREMYLPNIVEIEKTLQEQLLTKK